MLRPRPLAIHADLAFADDAEHAAAGKAWKQAHQELVETRAGGLRIDLDLPDATVAHARLWLYHLNLVVNCCF
jgi:hypothetical protein